MMIPMELGSMEKNCVRLPSGKLENSINIIKLSALLALGLFATSLWAEPVTLAFVTGDAKYTIAFDTAKIPESRMRELVILSPFIVDYTDATTTKNFWAAGSRIGNVVNKSFLALPLEQCIESDPAYIDCAKNDVTAPTFLRNAEINLNRSKRGLAWVKQLDYPRVLQSVVKFLQDELTLSIWTEETRFKYYTKWDERVLTEAHEEVDPVQLCPDVLKKLETASSKEDKYRIVRFDWANCMVGAANRRLGNYPTESWMAFLQAYGIKEHYAEKGPD